MVSINQILLLSALTVLALAEDCPAGNYMTKEHECIPCPIGTFQGADSKYGCRPCPPNTIAKEEGTSECTPCPVSTIPSRFKHQCVCPEGSDNRTGTCKKCTPGSQFVGFRSLNGCKTCQPGSYQPKFGQLECLKCADGSQSGYGAKECVTCTADQSFNMNNSKCQKCKAGFSPDNYSGACWKCGANRFKAEEGNGPCLVCPPGTHSGRGATECTECPDGEVLLADMTCGKCEAGHRFNTFDRKCVKCDFNTYSPSKSVRTTCYTCGGRTFSLKGATGCTRCPKMQYMFRDGTCKECPSGSVFMKHNLSCKKCRINQFSRGDMEYCETCPSGTYSAKGAETCFTCAANEALIARRKKCGSCRAGFFYESYEARCIICYKGSITTERGVPANCNPCGKNMTANDERTECIAK